MDLWSHPIQFFCVMFLWGISLGERHLKYPRHPQGPEAWSQLKEFRPSLDVHSESWKRKYPEGRTDPATWGAESPEDYCNEPKWHPCFWVSNSIPCGMRKQNEYRCCTLHVIPWCILVGWIESLGKSKVCWVMHDTWLSSFCNWMFCSSLKSYCSTFCIVQFIVLLSELVYNTDVQEQASMLSWVRECHCKTVTKLLES